MSANISFDRCLSFINMQIQPPAPHMRLADQTLPWRAVTISRITGSGGHSVAQELARLLQHTMPGNGRPWTVFDRNLVEKVLEDHHLPKRLAQFMPEDRVSEMRDTIDELFGLHPASWTLVRQTSETILRLADMGNVVLIGRGASVVTSKLSYVFHVRLVGSLEKRVQKIMETEKLSSKAALELISHEDRGRERYLKKHFQRDINDPLLYDLTINTDRITPATAVELIMHAMVGEANGVLPEMSAAATSRVAKVPL